MVFISMLTTAFVRAYATELKKYMQVLLELRVCARGTTGCATLLSGQTLTMVVTYIYWS